MANIVIGIAVGFIFGVWFGAGVMSVMAAAARAEEGFGQICAKSRGKM